MVFSNDEVLNDLSVGETYTVRQIYLFIKYGKQNAVVLSKTIRTLSDDSQQNVRVIKKDVHYVHQRVHAKKGETYLEPGQEKVIYVIE